jgi:CRP-like cAMP-binding protein
METSMADASFSPARFAQTLKKINFFTALTKKELDDLQSKVQVSKVKKGTVIIKQGDRGTAFCIIGEGKVSVWIEKSGFKTKVAELSQGQYFGEMSLISDEPRSASIVAEEDSELYVLGRGNFEKIFMDNPTVAEALQIVNHSRHEKNK